MPKKKRQLTLIELLVIIAILAILSAIMGPAVQRARQGARTPPAASESKRSYEPNGYFLRP